MRWRFVAFVLAFVASPTSAATFSITETIVVSAVPGTATPFSFSQTGHFPTFNMQDLSTVAEYQMHASFAVSDGPATVSGIFRFGPQPVLFDFNWNSPGGSRQGVQLAVFLIVPQDQTFIVTLSGWEQNMIDFGISRSWAADVVQTPLPAALPLFATGIALLLALRRRRS